MIKFLLCSSVLFILVNSGISHADEHFPLLGHIKHGSVNVRAGANTNFEIVLKLAQGDQCVVLGKNFEWYKIQAPQLAEAYIRADYVKELEGHYGELIGDKVNVRSKPKAESSPLCQLIKGDYVKLLEKKDGWWKIEAPAVAVAWVHTDFLKVSNDAIPEGLLRKKITIDQIKQVQAPKPVEILKPVIPIIKVVGMIVPMDTVEEGVHYKVVVDGKPVYLLQDAPYLERFRNTHVKIEAVSVNKDRHLEYPLLNIKKISVLL